MEKTGRGREPRLYLREGSGEVGAAHEIEVEAAGGAAALGEMRA